MREFVIGNRFDYTCEIDGSPVYYVPEDHEGDVVYLRIVKGGDNYSAYYSGNGTDYTQVGPTLQASFSDIHVGLLVCNGSTGTTAGYNADFDFIYCDGELVSPTPEPTPTPTPTPIPTPKWTPALDMNFSMESITLEGSSKITGDTATNSVASGSVDFA